MSVKTVKLINDADSDVYILPEARTKMEIYCNECDKEIGWMGFVKKVPNVGYLITDFVLIKQEVAASTTEIDPSALLELWGQISPEQQADLKIWGHSHVNMAPNPSGQDDSQMDYFKDGNDWFIRLITNKAKVINITIYDFKAGIEIHSDELITYDTNYIELKKAIKEEIKEKVKEKVYIPTKPIEIINKDYPKKLNGNYYKKDTNTCLDGINVKYVKSFDEALNDPNYWQQLI